jgi:fatty acid desaturase
VKSDRERREQARQDAASEARLQQRRDERALKRLFLVILTTMVGIAAIGYALAFWWE